MYFRNKKIPREKIEYDKYLEKPKQDDFEKIKKSIKLNKTKKLKIFSFGIRKYKKYLELEKRGTNPFTKEKEEKKEGEHSEEGK